MAFRVLLLDDERSVRKSFQLLLQEAGHQVAAASTVGEALERLERSIFDVAVIDIVMASDGGRRLLNELVEAHRGIGVVAITGDPTVFAELEHDAALDVRLVKPVTRDVLLHAVASAQASRMRRSRTRLRSGLRARPDRMARRRGA